ncbi:IS66-like element accessory protein TnpA [Celeribacter marinus]|uniref:IS66-like element accessory protein TnpA n=1 Tax=Celeribacter marinus TaxID=1397108 RepID=UPI000780BD1A|nr:transposase [Celeribacter marinus]SFK39861.1 transposase [Celeribacter marinus]
MRHEVIVGVERRRRWRDDEKQAILEEVGVNGATVTDVARRHDITRQHIYQWRRALRRTGLEAGSDRTVFLPLPPLTSDEASDVPVAAPAPEVDIFLRNGRRLRCAQDLPTASLHHLIRALETA